MLDGGFLVLILSIISVFKMPHKFSKIQMWSIIYYCQHLPSISYYYTNDSYLPKRLKGKLQTLTTDVGRQFDKYLSHILCLMV